MKEESLDITEIFVLALLVEFGLEAGIDFKQLDEEAHKAKKSTVKIGLWTCAASVATAAGLFYWLGNRPLGSYTLSELLSVAVVFGLIRGVFGWVSNAPMSVHKSNLKDALLTGYQHNLQEWLRRLNLPRHCNWCGRDYMEQFHSCSGHGGVLG